jgi:hypothetical protein
MNEPTGLAGTPPVAKDVDGLLRAEEPEVEHPRTNQVSASPLCTPTPLRAPMTPPPGSGSERTGSAFGYFSPSPLLFQATVESAPPTPSTEPAKVVGRDDPATAAVLEEGRAEGGDEDQGDRKHVGPGAVGEPPALVYVQPSPGQLERGVPVTGWLCDPEWLRRRFRDFTLGNVQGNQ